MTRASSHALTRSLGLTLRVLGALTGRRRTEGADAMRTKDGRIRMVRQVPAGSRSHWAIYALIAWWLVGGGPEPAWAATWWWVMPTLYLTACYVRGRLLLWWAGVLRRSAVVRGLHRRS